MNGLLLGKKIKDIQATEILKIHLLPYELRLQAAHARTLADAGILSSTDADAIASALDEIKRTHIASPSNTTGAPAPLGLGDYAPYSGAPAPLGLGDCPTSDAEDIHTWLEAELTLRVGDAGKRIHTARSRNDQVATLLAMYLIDSADQLGNHLANLVRTCAARAKTWAEIIMPMQTHAEFAAPGSAGFWILRFGDAFHRWSRRATWLHKDWQRDCPLGAGAVAGSSIPIDRQQQANGLGFDGPALNAFNATSSRDNCLEWLALLGHIGITMQSFAADVLAFCQTPFDWVDYPKAFGTGSSMMPNKHNPDAMELLRGEACALTAAHHQATTLMKGLTSGYQRDLQTIKPLVRNATETAFNLIALTTDFIAALEFKQDQLAACFNGGNLMATLAMEDLVKQGIPLRNAHHQIAQRIADGETFNAITPDTLKQYATTGSPNPSITIAAADTLLKDLDDHHR